MSKSLAVLALALMISACGVKGDLKRPTQSVSLSSHLSA